MSVIHILHINTGGRMQDRVTYDYYRIFYYVAKYKNISQAAKILGSNQPNISKVLKNLEGQLGCVLVTRSNKGITLTQEGEKLFKHVSSAYIQLKRGEEELLSASGKDSGIIHICTTEAALHGILLKKLSLFKKQYPDIKIHLKNTTTEGGIALLQKGFSDFILVTSPANIPKSFRQNTIMTFHEILIASPSLAIHNHDFDLTDAIHKYQIISPGVHSSSYAFYSNLFMEYGKEWSPDIETENLSMILPLVKTGLGIGFLPDFMASEDLKSGSVIRLKTGIDDELCREIILIEDPNKIFGSAALKFRACLL